MADSHPDASRTHDAFSLVLDPAAYEPLPDDWLIGLTDVVASTAAVDAGRYEDVNYAGASVIAALGNAWGSFDFPFVFRGDGAAFALPPHGFTTAASVLRQVAGYAKASLDLTLRAGLLPVATIRAGGRDVRIARYAASQDASYAMFAGGGLKWAERQIKMGRYPVEPDGCAPWPDLTGLTCDWQPFRSQQGEILSLLVEPSDRTSPEVFAALARQVLAIFDAGPGRSHPVPQTVAVPRDKDRRTDAKTWSEVAANSDFRKYDDALRLTLDSTVEQIEAVETILAAAKARGEVNYGLHRQSHALMTCLVPVGNPGSHMHFLDGLGGGYAKAAEMLEAGELQMA